MCRFPSFLHIICLFCMIFVRTGDCTRGFLDLLSKLSPKKFLNKNLVEQCKGQSVETMTHIFNYKSLKDKRENNLHKRIEGFIAGANGKIHIGYIGDREKCVAIKLIRNDFDKKRIFENSVLVMNKCQKRLPSRERQHIIELIDYGISIVNRNDQNDDAAAEELFPNSPQFGTFSDDEDDDDDDEEGNGIEYGALIMELGTETLGEKLYSERANFDNDSASSFIGLIRQMVLPLKELHKVAMHLDYKPDNLVFVELKEGNKILKVIDFDGTFLLPNPTDHEGRLANAVSEHLKILTGTDRYNPPEFYAELFAKKLSTKTDIWAVGMMLYEALFLQKKYNIYEEMGNSAKNFYKLLYYVNEIHRGFTLTRDSAKYIQQPIAYSAEWLTKFNAKILFWMFQTWKDFPLVGILITNLLSVVPPKRMSAKGILAFLDGECCPDEVCRERGEIKQMFADLPVKELVQNIEKRIEKVENLEEREREIVGLEKNAEKSDRKTIGNHQRTETDQNALRHRHNGLLNMEQPQKEKLIILLFTEKA